MPDPTQPPDPAVRRHGPDPLRVRVLTRAGCHLCDAAEQVVAAVCGELDVGWQTVDVDAAHDSEDLLDAYGEELPVTFVDGTMHDYWRVDAGRLTAALRARPDAAARRPGPTH